MSSAIEFPVQPAPSAAPEELKAISGAVLSRLQAFDRRRRILTTSRALAWIIVAVVALVLASTLIDATVYAVATRWWLAVGIYAATAIGLLLFVGRPWMSAPVWRLVAQQMEQREPKLRNRLLSAVELAQQPTHHDSAAFRRQVQSQVASLMPSVDVTAMLPWQANLRSSIAGCVAILVLGMLCMLPGLQMPHRLGRVLLPWANLGRITANAIRIQSPDVSQAAELIFPRGEMLVISATVTGPAPSSVQLELAGPAEGSAGVTLSYGSSIPMLLRADAASPGLYETVIPLESQWLDFRVTADGAETAWHRLQSVPRPRVDQFVITIEPPTYSLLASEEFTAPVADMIVYEDSQVRLEASCEHNVAELLGSIRWLDPRETEPADARLQSTGDNMLVAEFAGELDRQFRIELQHRLSGIANTFNPTYQLRVTKDLAPRVAWVTPTAKSAVAGQQEVVGLQLQVSDDMPLRGVRGRYRINGGEWRDRFFELDASINVATDRSRADQMFAATTIPILWLLDLSQEQLSNGDYVDVEVVAIDRKEQESVSTPLRIMISSLQWDLDATAAEQQRRGFSDKVRALAESSAQMADLAKQIRADNQRPADQLYDELAEQSSEFVVRSGPQIQSLREQCNELLRLELDPVSHQEIVGWSMWLEKLTQQVLPELVDSQITASTRLLDTPADQDVNRQRQQVVHPFADSINRFSDELKRTAEGVDAMTDFDVVRRVSLNALRLRSAIAQLMQDAVAEGTIAEVINRRREILAGQARQFQTTLAQRQIEVGQQAAGQIGWARDRLREATEALERIEQPVSSSLQWTYPAVGQIRTQLMSSTHQGANQGRRRIDEQAATVSSRVESLHKQMRENSTSERDTSGSVSQRLNDLRTILLTGDAADRQFAADVGAAARSLSESATAAQENLEQLQQVNKLLELLKRLEAVHALRRAHESVLQLLSHEGGRQSEAAMLVDHPRAFDLYQEQIERAVKLLREGKFPDEVVQLAEQIQWHRSAGVAAEKIGSRVWRVEDPVTAKPELSELERLLRQLLWQLNEANEMARQELQQQSPTLSELAMAAAEQSQQLSDATTDLADDVREDLVPEPPARLNQLNRDLQDALQPLEALRDALVDQAESADLLDAQMLEQARRADAALRVVAQARQQLSESLQGVEQDATDQMAQALEHAADRQTDVAEAMQQLAQFLDRDSINPSSDGQEGSGRELAELNELANQLANENESDPASPSADAYAQADRLAQISQLSPQQMLRSLERQLQNNAPMQRALDEISDTAAQQALRQLDRAAEGQREMQPGLEQSDPRTAAQRELMRHDLRTARNEAVQMLNHLSNAAAAAAQTGGQSSAAEQIRNAMSAMERNLNSGQSIDQANTIEQLQDVARNLKDTLQELSGTLAASQQAIDAARQNSSPNNEKDQERRVRDANSQQDRARNQDKRLAEHYRQTQQRGLKSVQDQLRRAEHDLQQHQNQLQRTENQLSQQPDQQWLRDAAERQRQEVALDEIRIAAARQSQQAFEQRVAVAEELGRAIEQSQPAVLNQEQPHSQLASTLAGQAAERAQHAAEQLAQWQTEWSAAPQATQHELNVAQDREQNVQNQVQAAARDLARAARHEARMDHEAAQSQLSSLAEQTQHVASGDLQQARDRLAESTAVAQQNHEASGQSSQESTGQSLAAIRQASEALGQAREDLAAAVEANSGQSSGDSSNNPAGAANAPSSGAAMSPQQMAQMLDDLDRQLSAAAAASSRAESSTASASANANGTLPPTLAQLANQLSSQLSRSRMQSQQLSQSPGSNSSMTGQATRDSQASVQPQAPVAVRVLDVNRIGADWGNLRAQAADQAVETKRDQPPDRYRRAIDAYFKALGSASTENRP